MADFHKIPFHLLTNPQNQAESEREMLALLGHELDRIVLARYM